MSLRPVPKIQDLEEVRDMVAFLDRRRPSTKSGKSSGGSAKTSDDGQAKPEPVDQTLAKALWKAMTSLLGEETFREQRACAAERYHMRGGICDLCGCSDNLYLQELERLLRRRRRR